ncbi:hypothetical protein LCGC14_0854370, partial [marine sediment metagenome]
MIPHKKVRKKTRILTLFIITIGLSLSTFNFFTLKPTSVSKMDKNLDDFNDNNLKISSYPQTFENSGEDINITLHQSYMNTSFDTIVNTSIKNNFNLPSPTDIFFNSTYTNITIIDIIAPKKVINVEDGNGSSEPIDTYNWAFSFTVLGNCILNNFSQYFSEDHPSNWNASISVYLYGAIWDITEQKMKPSNMISILFASYTIYDDTPNFLYEFTNIDESLDISDTNNNTFFIAFSQNTPSASASVRFH